MVTFGNELFKLQKNKLKTVKYVASSDSDWILQKLNNHISSININKDDLCFIFKKQRRPLKVHTYIVQVTIDYIIIIWLLK